MNKRKYKNETDGQIEFFKNYKIPYEGINSSLIDGTDGIYNGNIFEFKLNIYNLGKVLFQAIKYLSRERVRGHSIPSNILLISLNNMIVYVYRSYDYFDEIHQVYSGASSRNNDEFVAHTKYVRKLDYSNSLDSSKLIKILNENKYMPIKIDENCIIGWANRYYEEVPTASKGDFIGDDGIKIKIKGEIREPKHFKGLILPYEGATNEKFKYLMDCLNDRLKKKDLGAFYTPKPYCKKAAELVKMAVDRVPDGNDYIILDRCAGTGNLEEALEGIYDKNGSELISHCIVSTYEYYEYRVLFERLLGKVREIIPPSEENVIYSNGMVSNADAMSKEFIDNPIIKQYLDNPKCNVILFENPPFRDSSSANKKRDRNSLTRKSYVFSKMSQIKNTFRNKNISTVRDITNQFIWSGFKYYLRKIDDSYVLFSPCKWWKECGIADYMFLKGYLFNRKYFHASTSAVMCSVWSNINDSKTESIFLYSVEVEIIKVNKCYSTFSRFYKKSIDGIQTNVFCESSGYETKGRKCCGKSIYSDDIIAYLTTKGFSLDANNNNLVRMTHYNNRGTYMTKKNYLYFLPLFVAKS